MRCGKMPVIGKLSTEKGQIMLIETKRIKPNPYNTRSKVDSEKLLELSNSIREHGQVVPIRVRPANNEYEIVYGYRRWLACKLALLPNVRCIVENATDDKVLLDSIIENLHHESLNPIDEAKAFEILRRQFKMSTYSIADEIGKTEPYVVQRLRLLQASPDFQKLIKGVDEVLSDGVIEPEPSHQLKLGLTQDENAKLFSTPRFSLPVSTAQKIIEKEKNKGRQLEIAKVITEHKLTQSETDKFLKELKKDDKLDLNKLASKVMNSHAMILDIPKHILEEGSWIILKLGFNEYSREDLDKLFLDCLEICLQALKEDRLKVVAHYTAGKDGKIGFGGLSLKKEDEPLVKLTITKKDEKHRQSSV
jgi:ParB/RepB/Spo0J family partition protein